jgi:hypothetical protein
MVPTGFSFRAKNKSRITKEEPLYNKKLAKLMPFGQRQLPGSPILATRGSFPVLHA